MKNKNSLRLCIGTAALMSQACSPIIRVQAPDKPITINLNVTIDQQVQVNLDEDVDDLIAENPDIF
ncbi:YnbE family lipoprotein [Hirschia litorea]|uniref:YnbE family lipoprotein n=1 Tax=Hirschia litorea TaxID=1199156 RepID=A0ABW2IMC7_9PROT